jgi:uncharacterized metal-binding protein YceD (DUF177 family)
VNHLKQFTIVIAGLSDGFHNFEFILENHFFKSIDDSDVCDGNLTAKIRLEKRHYILIFDVNIEGKVEVQCDRCLDNYSQPIVFKGKLYAKYGLVEEENENEDVIFITREDTEIDLSNYMYESVMLSIPYKRLHPKNKSGNIGCNPEMIEKLKKYLVQREEEDNFDEEELAEI